MDQLLVAPKLLQARYGVERWEEGSDPYIGAAYLVTGPVSGTVDLEAADARITGTTRS